MHVNARVQEFRPGGATSANLTTTELSSATVTRRLEREPAARADARRHRRAHPAEHGDRGRRDRQRRDERRLRPRERRPRLLGEPGGDARPAERRGRRRADERLRRDRRSSATTARTPRCARRAAACSRGRATSTPSGSSSTTCSCRPPTMNVGDHYLGAIVGVLDYNFGNFFLEATAVPPVAHDGVHARDDGGPRQPTSSRSPPSTSRTSRRATRQSKFDRLAGLDRQQPARAGLIAVEEMQDNNGRDRRRRRGRRPDA